MLTDNHNRVINYLRLSVTDNCNMRCQYCMPAEGVEFSHNKELLSWDEMFLLSSTFIELGITKIRITGGEPFVRKGLMDFLHRLAAVKGQEEISITTNATLIGEHIAALKALGILNINVSMDSLDKDRFNAITRRNYFDVVYNNVLQLLQNGFNVKINCVVMNGLNTDDILPFVEFAHEQNVSVRFLEEMPFNGHSKGFEKIEWDFLKIMDHIQQHFPGTHRMNDGPSSTSENYTIENRRGSFGIIPSFSRTFCGTCNRIRVSAKGELQTCLYTNESVSFKRLLQQNPHPDLIKPLILKAIHNRFKDGFEAEEKNEFKKSMSLIGG
ncbi:GTP 3',8-cyclase MoaA [Ferruginibacter paludis]|uniref:GTP 3',8-cyclase MoaA n=1 Tax=Ferruginibacter paludis TaxID=1310417 RepID=UPI0025B38637|nr:GTP 3',8-cyclase MoaA [Ferruginibacter paludis]MDN3656365.1 GTP 3',8-cyclase MoaA [Ferruginibacter paludis]